MASGVLVDLSTCRDVPPGEVTGKSISGGTLEGNSMDPSGFRNTVVDPVDWSVGFVLTRSKDICLLFRVGGLMERPLQIAVA